MAFVRIPSESATKAFAGLSTDQKPYPVTGAAGAVDPQAGTLFFELDTGLVYVFSGTEWAARAFQTDARIVEQLDRIAELLSHQLDVLIAMQDP